jgi:glutathione peroxidase
MQLPTKLGVLVLSLILMVPLAARPEDDPEPVGKVSVLDLDARKLGGDVESLTRYRGQVLLIVNTASRCAYTPQYEGLQNLYARYRERGFSVLGFPSNDFGKQEPGNDSEIASFCGSTYGVEFPMFSKIRVRGDDIHPVYRYLTALPAPIGGAVQWNFQKYLIDRRGNVIARYAPSVRPEHPDLVAEIERLLSSTDVKD